MIKKLMTAGSLLRQYGFGVFWEELVERTRWSTSGSSGVLTQNTAFLANAVETIDSRPPFRVSLVVPVFNAGADLRVLLASVARQRGCHIETIIIDSGSTDGCLQAVEGVSNLRLFRLDPRDFHHARTRNWAVSLSQQALVFLTVQDAELPGETWLYQLCSLRERLGASALSAMEFPRGDADAYARYSLERYFDGTGLNGAATLSFSRWPDGRGARELAASIGNVGCLYLRDALVTHPFEGSFGEDFSEGVMLLKHGLTVARTSELLVTHSHNRPAYYWLKRLYAARNLLVRERLTSRMFFTEPRQQAAAVLFFLKEWEGFLGQQPTEALRTLEGIDPSLYRWLARPDLTSLVQEVRLVGLATQEEQSLRSLFFDDRAMTTLGANDAIFRLKFLAARLGWALAGAPAKTNPWLLPLVEGV